jgi:8-oxo-dGTP diphosphatase
MTSSAEASLEWPVQLGNSCRRWSCRFSERSGKPQKEKMKRQRATVIVEIDTRILLVQNRGGLLLLPGGGIHSNESPLQAAARELAEETQLVARSLLFLFGHESPSHCHTVFWAAAAGTALAGDDATALHLFAIGDHALSERMSAASQQIVERFLDMRRGRAAGLPAQVIGASAGW